MGEEEKGERRGSHGEATEEWNGVVSG